MARYRFVRSENKIICLSSYGKKVVRGIAKCSPNDDFSVTIGERLAQYRCDAKVEEKRMKRATEKYKEALENFAKAKKHLFAMEDYYTSACEKYGRACEELNQFENMI